MTAGRITFLRHAHGPFEARRTMPPVIWPHHDLLFVHAGEVGVELPGLAAPLLLRPGTGVLIFPHTRFQCRSISPVSRASVQHFRLQGRMPGILGGIARRRGGFLAQGAPPSEGLAGLANHAIALSRRPGSKVLTAVRTALLTAMVGEAFFSAAPARAADPPRIDPGSLEAWLEKNLPGRPRVADLAGLARLSPSRYRAVFAIEQGRSPGSFLRERRMNRARQLLGETGLTLKEISAVLGYSDVVAFHRAFRTFSGFTPGRYRRDHRLAG